MTRLKQTPLHALHRELGARLVPFAGYEMPVQYPGGIRAEHEHTRTHASLFDVSHMGQITINGRDAADRLEHLVPGDIAGLRPGQQRYTVLTNSEGGVIDDLMITRIADNYLLVVNAACKDRDYRYLQQALMPDCRVEYRADRALLAIQGPEATSVLAEYHADIPGLPFLGAGEFRLAGIDSLVHRCGYTGEDGFELSVDAGHSEQLARMLLKNPLLKPAGLGARDSLRLEAGLCLYGHELDETTTPVEADIAWVVAKKYRMDNPQPAYFPGAEKILAQLTNGPDRIRRGFLPEGKIPVREGTTILDNDGLNAGIITSGGYGQTVGRPVAMGYLSTRLAGTDMHYKVEIRNRMHAITCVELPFVEHRYHKNS